MAKARKRGVVGPDKRRPLVNDPELISLMSLVEGARYVEIEHAARRMLARRHNPFVLKALSFSLIGQERFEDALPVLSALQQTVPADAEIHTNCGIAMTALLRWDEAVESFQRALELDPNSLQAYSSLGIVYFRMHRWGDAVPPLLKAIELSPDDNVGAIEVLADCLLNAGRVDEAWTCYQELYRNDSSNVHTLYQVIWSNLLRCRWDELDKMLLSLRKGSSNFSASLDSPFIALAYPGLTSADHLAVAQSFALRTVDAKVPAPDSMRGSSVDMSEGRLKLAYISSDFRFHPVGFVLPEVIERHDRSRVEVFGYSTGVNDDSDVRQRLAKAFDHFVDVENYSMQKMVNRIHDDGIDVLVDLNGWTVGHRAEVLASRCAPVKVNWLGYPGTIGHPDLADYILGDAVVTPEADADLYAELIAQLPNCYLPSDTTRGLAAPPSRKDVSLPESGFVFCALNASYKLNPWLFDAWSRILLEAADSVLWLPNPGDDVAARLRHEAEARGVAGERLVFAPRVQSTADHLARMQLADIALDTFPYNSHSSGADVLWAGVPMITRMGETFASRVGASMLMACGLPDLVTTTTEDYVALAVDLHKDRSRLADVRSRLAVRTKSPLFDMSGFVQALEAVFYQMWEQHRTGSKKPIYQ